MQITLEQTFPLGRFHATPWKVFPYDDPHGEWPPSPWRLVRAVLARSFQLDREIVDSDEAHAKLREKLVHAFATSEVSWRLPPSTWRGPGLRQYHPAEFKRVPASASEPGMMAYNTTKVLDNFWVTANGTAAPVIWHFDGPDWTPPLLAHLDACLARMTYFGRAESITEIRRTEAAALPGEVVKLSSRRSGRAVPVLALQANATLAQLEVTTDAPSVKDTNIPPGSRWMYAERPTRPQIRPVKKNMVDLPSTNFIQFALGYTVTPRYRDAVRITERFRYRAINCLEQSLGIPPKGKWAALAPEVREKIYRFAGKDAESSPAKGHNHAAFILCGEETAPSRLCVWRSEPFTSEEHRAILAAASAPLPLNYGKGSWTITLVPLDRLVPPPPGFGSKECRMWTSLTPYVPALHVHDRKGRVKDGYSVKEQVVADLAERGYPIPVDASAEDASWVKVHGKAAGENKQTNSDKRGYHITLKFGERVTGPILLGASSHFGLGLFIPVGD